MIRIFNHSNSKCRESAIDEHIKIAEAIISRNRELAKKYIIEHIKVSEKFTI